MSVSERIQGLRGDRSRDSVGLFGYQTTGGGGSLSVVLTSPDDGTPTSSGTSNALVTSSVGSGILYRGCVSNGGSCTNAQLIAGTGGNLVAASCGNQAITASGVQTITSITGLDSATTYQIKFLAYSGGFYSLQSSVDLTTS